jgi:chromosome partitioning protein
MHIWAVANQKGGVGKTTTVVSLGGLLAEKGHRVLLLDLDPHGSLTSYFGYGSGNLEKSSIDLFGAGDIAINELQSLIKTTTTEGLTLIPSSMILATVERRASTDGMGLKVARALALLWDSYDYVLIDCPPVLGALMINALAACERLIIPVQTEFLALQGLERMLRTILMVTRSLKKEFDYIIVPTMFDLRTQASKKTLLTMQNTYADTLWESIIPIDTHFRDASREGLTPSQYDSNSRGVVAYRELLKLLLSQQQQRKRA